MEKLKGEKINDEACSFNFKSEISDYLKEVSLVQYGELDYESFFKERNHSNMEKIMGLSYRAIRCVKAIHAMAGHIQGGGYFDDHSYNDFTLLGMYCNDLIRDILEIADAPDRS